MRVVVGEREAEEQRLDADLDRADRHETKLCHPSPPRHLAAVSHLDRITFDPEQCGGRPCIRHYRLRVKDLLDLLAARVPEAEILADLPFLVPEDIQACVEYAA